GGEGAGRGEGGQARVVVAPVDGEVAPGELDGRAGPRGPGRWVGRARRGCGDAGRQARRRPERLGVDAEGVDPHRRESGADLLHERGRAAEVRLRLAGRVERGERRCAEPAGAVVVAALAVARAGAAIT